MGKPYLNIMNMVLDIAHRDIEKYGTDYMTAINNAIKTVCSIQNIPVEKFINTIRKKDKNEL